MGNEFRKGEKKLLRRIYCEFKEIIFDLYNTQSDLTTFAQSKLTERNKNEFKYHAEGSNDLTSAK